jgi:hypothetical protein
VKQEKPKCKTCAFCYTGTVKLHCGTVMEPSSCRRSAPTWHGPVFVESDYWCGEYERAWIK